MNWAKSHSAAGPTHFARSVRTEGQAEHIAFELVRLQAGVRQPAESLQAGPMSCSSSVQASAGVLLAPMVNSLWSSRRGLRSSCVNTRNL